MRFFKSFSFRILMLFFVITALLVSMLFATNLYFIRIVQSQVIESYQNLLPRYVDKQDDSLKAVRNYLLRSLNHSTVNIDIYGFSKYPYDSDTYNQSSLQVFGQLKRDIASFSNIDVLFIYSSNNDQILAFTNSMLIPALSVQNETYKTVKDLLINNKYKEIWQYCILNGVPGLLSLSSDGGNTYMGAFVGLHHLLSSSSNKGNKTDLGMIITDNNGNILVSSQTGIIRLLNDYMPEIKPSSYQTVTLPNDRERYLLISAKSGSSNIFFTEVISEKQLLDKLQLILRIIQYIPLFMLLIAACYFYIIQKAAIHPVHRLTQGMESLISGNLDIVLEEKGPHEFRFFIQTFNNMVAQIKNLRIDVYENQLQAQHAELEAKEFQLCSLQMQINPHFFANSLNIIHSLAAIKDHAAIQKMALHLTNYFRYIMHTSQMETELRNEASFTRDYLEIQKMRFTKHLSYSINIGEEYLNQSIPPLTLQPFVENAIIHGFVDTEKGLDIKIYSNPSPDNADCFIMVIEDNGKGFQSEEISSFSDPAFLKQNEGSHIGIWNVYTRLQMSFGDRARIIFSNGQSGGACVQICLPLHTHNI